MNALLNRTMSESRNISIVGFPCNQFAYQEPADNKTELLNGLYYVRPGDGYTPNFHLMSKIRVNGEGESDVYAYLKETCPLPEAAVYYPRRSFWYPIKPRDVAWNFEKFLVDRDGLPVFRFLSAVEPFDIENIMKLMSDGTVTKSNVLSIESIRNDLKTLDQKYTDKM